MFKTLRYPTKQQGIIWLRRRQKDRPTDIANDLRVSRPFVTMEQKRAEGRIKKLDFDIDGLHRLLVEIMQISLFRHRL